MLLVGLVAMGSCLAMASVGEGQYSPRRGPRLSPGPLRDGLERPYLTRLSESVPMHAAATAMGASLTIAFVGMFWLPRSRARGRLDGLLRRLVARPRRVDGRR